MYLTYDPDEWDEGLASDHLRRRDGVPSLEEMQEHVGGYVEAVDLHRATDGRRLTCWLNDEGALTKLTPAAYVEAINQVVRGPLLFTAVTPAGETAGLTEEEVRSISLGDRSAFLHGFGPVPVLACGLPYDAAAI